MTDKMADKSILLGLGFFLLLDGTRRADTVLAFLLAVIVAALGIYIEEKKYVVALIAAVFLVSFWNEKILLFFPVFLYDMVFPFSAFGKNIRPAHQIYKKYCFLTILLFLLRSLSLLDSLPKTVFWLITAAFSAMLAYKTEKNRYLTEELIRIRDDGEELNRVLKEKNKNLLEKQDYEIYLATLKERNRIAREIHDNVGHMLSRSILMTAALLTIEKKGAVQEQLLQMKDTLNEAMTSIRNSVHNLHEDYIDLRQSVKEIVELIREEYEVKLEYDMSDFIPNPVKYCMIATTKEAVSNILKHSNADWVRFSFREHPGFYQLLIEDNGTGARIKKGAGIGLQNMKERSDALQGTFHVQTNPGFGIFMTIPKKTDAKIHIDNE